MNATSVTLATVARHVGVSVSTVSLALRGDPRVLPPTRARVEVAARELGYRPNPQVAALMAHIRQGHRPAAATSLAFVWVGTPREATLGDAFNAATRRGVVERATAYGLAVAEFWLADPGMSPRRLVRLLAARGVRGVVFSGSVGATAIEFPADCGGFAAAVVGNASWTPEFHRAAVNHYRCVEELMRHAARLGWRRPALVFDADTNERAHRHWTAAFLAFHPTGIDAAHYLYACRGHDLPATAPTAARLAANPPDGWLLDRPHRWRQWRTAHPAATHGRPALVVNLTALPGPGEPGGMLPRHDQIGAAAVDLVMNQLHHNESGPPARAQTLLIPADWCEPVR